MLSLQARRECQEYGGLPLHALCPQLDSQAALQSLHARLLLKSAPGRNGARVVSAEDVAVELFLTSSQLTVLTEVLAALSVSNSTAPGYPAKGDSSIPLGSEVIYVHELSLFLLSQLFNKEVQRPDSNEGWPDTNAVAAAAEIMSPTRRSSANGVGFLRQQQLQQQLRNQQQALRLFGDYVRRNLRLVLTLVADPHKLASVPTAAGPQPAHLLSSSELERAAFLLHCGGGSGSDSGPTPITVLVAGLADTPQPIDTVLAALKLNWHEDNCLASAFSGMDSPRLSASASVPMHSPSNSFSNPFPPPMRSLSAATTASNAAAYMAEHHHSAGISTLLSAASWGSVAANALSDPVSGGSSSAGGSSTTAAGATGGSGAPFISNVVSSSAFQALAAGMMVNASPSAHAPSIPVSSTAPNGLSAAFGFGNPTNLSINANCNSLSPSPSLNYGSGGSLSPSARTRTPGLVASAGQMDDTCIAGVHRGTVVRGEGELPTGEVRITDCHDSVVYILAPLQSALLSGCSDCTVVLGAVGAMLRMERCDRVQLHVAANRILISSCHECVLYLGVGRPPCLVGDNRFLRLAPLNTRYERQAHHLHQAGVHMEVPNRWDSPVVLAGRERAQRHTSGPDSPRTTSSSAGDQKSAFSLLPPDEFLPYVVPFVGGPGALAGGPAPAHTTRWRQLQPASSLSAFSSSSNSCAHPYVYALPLDYEKAVQRKLSMTGELRNKFKQAGLTKEKERDLNDVIQAYFKDWLSNSGLMRQIFDLSALEREEQGLRALATSVSLPGGIAPWAETLPPFRRSASGVAPSLFSAGAASGASMSAAAAAASAAAASVTDALEADSAMATN